MISDRVSCTVAMATSRCRQYARDWSAVAAHRNAVASAAGSPARSGQDAVAAMPPQSRELDAAACRGRDGARRAVFDRIDVAEQAVAIDKLAQPGPPDRLVQVDAQELPRLDAVDPCGGRAGRRAEIHECLRHDLPGQIDVAAIQVVVHLAHTEGIGRGRAGSGGPGEGAAVTVHPDVLSG